MRHVPSARPSMEEGCEFEVFYIKDPRTHYFMHRIRNIFADVWYKAIVEAKPPKSPKSKLCVRLLKDDFSTPLVEFTDEEVLCRSIPPKHLLDSIHIRIGSIVEADYKDAWVTGFVVKEIDDDKCLVCFDSPPDIIEFDRKHLRRYLQWVDKGIYTEWEVTSRYNGEFLTRLHKEPMFSPGTMVEVSSDVKKVATVSWVPAMIIKEFKEDGEYKYIVKGNEAARPNEKPVGLRSLRPTPPPFKVEEYQLMEYVEVFHGRGWRQGRVIKTLSHKKYLVLLESTKKQLTFKHSDLRPLKVWEDGVWKTMESPLTQGSGDNMSDSVMNAKESDPPVTPSPSITETLLKQIEADPPVTPSPGITETLLKQTEAETQRETFPKKTLLRNQNGSGKDSTRENENSEDITRKRKREENLCSDASVKDSKAKDTTRALPFEKKLPIWKTLESMEVFKTVPQNPHFSPLAETCEDSREMSAVGMMLTFSGLLDEVKALKRDDSIGSFISLGNSLAELEKHGFSVKAPQLRISKLLSLRDRQSKKIEERKDAEKVTAEKESVKVELERKILELQRLNEEVDKELAQSKSCAAKIVKQLEDVKLEFQATASAPW